MKYDIYNSKGIHVGLVIGPAIFDLTGKLLYELKGTKIYRASGELVGHRHDASGSETLRPQQGGRPIVLVAPTREAAPRLAIEPPRPIMIGGTISPSLLAT